MHQAKNKIIQTSFWCRRVARHIYMCSITSKNKLVIFCFFYFCHFLCPWTKLCKCFGTVRQFGYTLATIVADIHDRLKGQCSWRNRTISWSERRLKIVSPLPFVKSTCAPMGWKILNKKIFKNKIFDFFVLFQEKQYEKFCLIDTGYSV